MYKSLENAIRGVFTEEKADMGDVQDLLRKTLEKEGGAAGLGALEKAVKDHKGVNVKDVLSKMSDVALHKHGDYYLKEAASGDCECTTEECDCNEPICVTCGKERDVVREGSDDHIIMQLRKAQDVRGNKEIKFRRGSAKVDPRHIDKILKLHNHPGMKPNDKRKLRIMISKSPQDLAKVAKGIKEDTTTLNYIDYNVKTISEEFILSEAVKLDRFKKANRGKGPNPRQVSMYAFTTKKSGDPKDKEMTIIDKPMKLADAGKEAMKKLKSKTVYVMEADEVKPHMMYDPKTGKGVMAKDKADHERLAKKGYVHDKPEVKEKFANAAQQAAVMAKLKKDGKYKEKNEAYDEPQGQAKRMSSPLQKARMDKEKADRDRDGKLKAGIGAMKKAGNAKADAEKDDMSKRLQSREKEKRQHDLATKSRQKGDLEKAKKHDDIARKAVNEKTRLDKIIEYALKKEVKSAPKGYHFTKSGQLKKGDADVDGDGGEKLRSDPLDKRRKKIPPLPENDK